MTFTYWDVRGGVPGEGNIEADPLFADPNGDYHLRSKAPTVIWSAKIE